MSTLSHTETLECQLFALVILRTTGNMATHYTPALGKSIIPQITSLGKDQSSKHELDVVFYLCNPRHQGLRHETLQFENILSESKFEASLVNILRPYFKRKRRSSKCGFYQSCDWGLICEVFVSLENSG